MTTELKSVRLQVIGWERTKVVRVADRTLKEIGSVYPVLHWAILNANALFLKAGASLDEKGTTAVFSLSLLDFEQGFPVPNQALLHMFSELRRHAETEAKQRGLIGLGVEVTFRIQDHP